MRHTAPIYALLLCLATASGLYAQEAAAPAAPAEGTAAPAEGSTPPAEGAADSDLSMGAPAPDGIGSTYTEAEFGDWEQRCIRTEDGSNPCQLYQLLNDSTGNAVAELSVFNLPAGGQAVAGATIIAPLETLLTQDLTFQIGTAAAKRYPFSWCAPIGCVARIGFVADELTALKNGSTAKVTIVPAVAPDQKVELTVSLTGFTAGMDAVAAANAP